ncbi:MAG: RND transporter [Pirellulales bacterium]
MKRTVLAHCVVLSVAVAMGGCTSADDNPGGDSARTKAAAKPDEGLHNYAGRDWCGEHGIPESVCAQCDFSLVADFKEQGDWCTSHDRPQSQCFVCKPELKDQFAATYRAKYGEDPPPMVD